MHTSECRAQEIARRDKKDFLSDQCKEIQKNNRATPLEIVKVMDMCFLFS